MVRGSAQAVEEKEGWRSARRTDLATITLQTTSVSTTRSPHDGTPSPGDRVHEDLQIRGQIRTKAVVRADQNDQIFKTKTQWKPSSRIVARQKGPRARRNVSVESRKDLGGASDRGIATRSQTRSRAREREGECRQGGRQGAVMIPHRAGRGSTSTRRGPTHRDHRGKAGDHGGEREYEQEWREDRRAEPRCRDEAEECGSRRLSSAARAT